MFYKLYPKDQIKNYLLLDVVIIVFLFYYVLSYGSGLGFVWSSLLLVVVLVSFYVALWHRDVYLLAAVLIGTAAIATFALHIGLKMMLFGFIFADLLGRSRSRVHIGIGITGMALLFLFVYWKVTDGELVGTKYAIFLPIMVTQMLVPIVVCIKERAKSLQNELDMANRQLEYYIQEEERQRIARDLHDTLGQTLTMIKLKSELAAKWVDKDPVQAKAEMKDILATSRTALKQVRELVSDMKFISLASEVERSRKVLHTVGIGLEMEERGKPPLLSSVEETMLAMSLREAVTNIVKHSQASLCKIRIETTEEAYTVMVTDNGVGLIRTEHGNGLQSMKERMQALHGTLTVHSPPGGGTVISMQLPLHRQGKENSET